MARDTSIWGPDAGEFNPDRWVDADGSLKKESQWKAHAFNGGYRLCVPSCLLSDPSDCADLDLLNTDVSVSWTRAPPERRRLIKSASIGQNLALYEGTSVLAAIAREFDFAFADNYLETTQMCDNEFTPKYKGALTLSMVRSSSFRQVCRSDSFPSAGAAFHGPRDEAQSAIGAEEALYRARFVA